MTGETVSWEHSVKTRPTQSDWFCDERFGRWSFREKLFRFVWLLCHLSGAVLPLERERLLTSLCVCLVVCPVKKMTFMMLPPKNEASYILKIDVYDFWFKLKISKTGIIFTYLFFGQCQKPCYKSVFVCQISVSLCVSSLLPLYTVSKKTGLLLLISYNFTNLEHLLIISGGCDLIQFSIDW